MNGKKKFFDCKQRKSNLADLSQKDLYWSPVGSLTGCTRAWKLGSHRSGPMTCTRHPAAGTNSPPPPSYHAQKTWVWVSSACTFHPVSLCARVREPPVAFLGPWANPWLEGGAHTLIDSGPKNLHSGGEFLKRKYSCCWKRESVVWWSKNKLEKTGVHRDLLWIWRKWGGESLTLPVAACGWGTPSIIIPGFQLFFIPETLRIHWEWKQMM